MPFAVLPDQLPCGGEAGYERMPGQGNGCDVCAAGSPPPGRLRAGMSVHRFRGVRATRLPLLLLGGSIRGCILCGFAGE